MKLKPTQEQKLIIKNLHGHAMVKAGPGCAKTATLALRVMHMLKQGYEPSSIVILTHGKALSLDIVETLSKLVNRDVVQQITVSTIHSFAYLLVRKYYQLLEYDEVPTLVKQQGKNLFIKRHAKLTGLKLAELKQAFSQYDATSIKSAKVEAALGKDNATLARKAYNRYSRYKMKRNTVDFNDMIKGAIKLLKLRPNSTLRGYEHLMVDELQDIDGPQKEFLLHLSRKMKSTVMVGDPLQSIYGWRRSLPRYWTDIEKALTPKQFELTQSFRTPRQALALVNDLGRRIDGAAPILTSKVEGEAPVLLQFIDQEQQLIFLAKEIKKLRASGVKAKQIVILGKTRPELGQAALALKARGIEVFERYMPTNTNRHKTHLLALIQLTRLEQVRLSKCSKTYNREEQAQARSCMENLWLPKKAIQLLQERLTMKPRAILSVKSDSSNYKRIHDLSNAIKNAVGLTSIESAVQCLIDASKAVLKDKDDRHHKLLQRDLADIKIKSRNCKTLNDIEDDWFQPTTVKDDGVQLMTCHGAKGQQRDYVFIINVVQGIFPRHQSSVAKAMEEYRVFYVAVTRHHQKLYLLQTPTPTRKITKKFGSGARSCSMKPVIFDETSCFIDIKKQGLDHKSYI